LWLQVIVIPDESKIIVFTKGRPHGSRVIIFFGGQADPISTAAFKLQWRNPQKNELKNMTSERIKRIKANLIPFCTFTVWCPSYVLSIITSINHLVKKKQKNTRDNTMYKLLFL
jgi:hypothetical protein